MREGCILLIFGSLWKWQFKDAVLLYFLLTELQTVPNTQVVHGACAMCELSTTVMLCGRRDCSTIADSSYGIHQLGWNDWREGNQEYSTPCCFLSQGSKALLYCNRIFLQWMSSDIVILSSSEFFFFLNLIWVLLFEECLLFLKLKLSSLNFNMQSRSNSKSYISSKIMF